MAPPTEDTLSRVRDLEGSVSQLMVGVATLGVQVEHLAKSIEGYTTACEAGTKETKETKDALAALHTSLAPLQAPAAPPSKIGEATEWVQSNWLAIMAGLIVFAVVLDLVRGTMSSDDLLDRLERIEQVIPVDIGEGDGLGAGDTSPTDSSPPEGADPDTEDGQTWRH